MCCKGRGVLFASKSGRFHSLAVPHVWEATGQAARSMASSRPDLCTGCKAFLRPRPPVCRSLPGNGAGTPSLLPETPPGPALHPQPSDPLKVQIGSHHRQLLP